MESAVASWQLLLQLLGRMALANSMILRQRVWGMWRWFNLPPRCLRGLSITSNQLQIKALVFNYSKIMSRKAGSNSNGTQLLRPKQKKRTETKVEDKKQEEYVMPKKGGIKIGDSTDSDKWRCRTCKHLNPLQADDCLTCGDPKQLSHPPKAEMKP